MKFAPDPSPRRPTRRILLALLVGTGLTAGAVLAHHLHSEWIANPYRSDAGWPVLRHAPADASGRSVHVEANRHVSHEHPDVRHLEVVGLHAPGPGSGDAAGGADGRLVAASMYLAPGEARQRLVRVFESVDGGVEWKCVHEITPTEGDGVHDPTLATDSRGNVLLATMDASSDETHRIALARRDSETNRWSDHTLLEADLDRPWIEIDAADPEAPVLWLLAQRNEVVLHSFDARDLTPLSRHSTRQGWVSPRPARPVLRVGDSPLLVAQNRFPVWSDRLRMCVPQISVLAPIEARGLEAAREIGGRWRGETDWEARPASHSMFPVLAGRADAERFSTHIYCVWAAQPTPSPDDERILFSRSTDSGDTWSTPVVLSENDAPGIPPAPFLAFMPAVHVNREGVVGVTWYDRRGLPQGTASRLDEFTRRHEFPGQNVRFRASVDGGASFLPSVLVNDRPSARRTNLGHTQGLTSTPDGRFHAVWIDGRQGDAQVYTAALRIAD